VPAKASEQPESNPLLLFILVVAGVWFFNRDAAPTPNPEPPAPVVSDVLQDAYNADRKTQVAVLRELAQQPFDGATDEGRRLAGEWFNKQRFRNRADDFGAYTDAVAEAIATNTEAELAAKLEVKPNE
jgi:hypothetical protein